jgi:hypothetical protein
MLKALGYGVAPLLIVVLLTAAAYLLLKRECSLNNSLAKLDEQSQQNRPDDQSKASDAGEHNSTPESKNAKPSARFDLNVASSNKVEGHYHTQDTEREGDDWGHKFLCETKIGEFSLAVLTLALVVVTGMLWFATDRLVRGAEETARKQLRAYLVIDGIELIRQNKESGKKLTHHLKIINTGQTPARKMRIDAITRILDHPISVAFDIRLPITEERSSYSLGRDKSTLFAADADRLFTEQEITETASESAGGKRIYSYGTVWYEDVFGSPRFTAASLSILLCFSNRSASARAWRTSSIATPHWKVHAARSAFSFAVCSASSAI